MPAPHAVTISNEPHLFTALRDDLKQQAHALGFVSFGIAEAVDDMYRAERLKHWLAGQNHGQMAWMESRAEERANPRTLWPRVNSVIALGMSYAPGTDPLLLADHHRHGRISIYAQGSDYHDTVKKALKTLARWLIARCKADHLLAPDGTAAEVKVFVDTAPVMEKPLAQSAGLGWQGKHTNLVSRTQGSWLFLGFIYTNLALRADAPARDHCGSCRACQDVCPTNAFPAPYQLDARRCISYLTIEHKGPIDESLRPLLGNHIYGCDDCLAICPWNRFAQSAARHRAFLPRAELATPRLADLLALDDSAFRSLFAGSPIKRIGRERLIRNGLYAAGNSHDTADNALRKAIAALLNDPDPTIQDAAQWATSRLMKYQQF